MSFCIRITTAQARLGVVGWQIAGLIADAIEGIEAGEVAAELCTAEPDALPHPPPIEDCSAHSASPQTCFPPSDSSSDESPLPAATCAASQPSPIDQNDDIPATSPPLFTPITAQSVSQWQITPATPGLTQEIAPSNPFANNQPSPSSHDGHGPAIATPRYATKEPLETCPTC